MSNNMLTTLDFIPQLPPSISNLDLRQNLMEQLELDLSSLVNLRDCYLSQNLWQCSCKIKDILEWVLFTISFKEISSYAFETQFQFSWFCDQR